MSRHLPLSAACLSVVLTAACSEQSGNLTGANERPDLVVAPAPIAPESIYSRYIVTFTDSVSNPSLTAAAVATKVGGRKLMDMLGMKAFVIVNISATDLGRLRTLPMIASVDTDEVVRVGTTQPLPSDGSLWSLDLIDQRVKTPNFQFSYFFPGSGIHVYIVDTGIRGDQVDFSGRLGTGATLIGAYPGDSPFIRISVITALQWHLPPQERNTGWPRPPQFTPCA